MAWIKNSVIVICVVVAGGLLGYFGYQNWKHNQTDVLINLENEEEIKSYLEKLRFTGTWNNLLPNSSLLNNDSGRASFQIYSPVYGLRYAIFNYTTISKWHMRMVLEDPLHYDGNLIQILQPFNKTISENGTFGFEALHNFRIYTHDTYQTYNLKRMNTKFCNYTGTMELNSLIFENNMFNVTRLESLDDAIQVNLTSQNAECKLHIVTNVGVDETTAIIQQTIYFTLLLSVGICNWYGAFKILTSINETISYVDKLSLWTLIGVNIQDSFIFIFHLTFAVGFLDSSSILIIFFVYFFLFVLIDYRIVLFVWRYQAFRAFDHLQDLTYHRKLYYLQLKICGLIFLYNYLMWKFFLNEWFLVINAAILLPQILHNLMQNNAPEFDPYYLVFYSSMKYLVFWYIRGYPKNIFNIEHYCLLMGIGGAIMLLSLLVLYLQERMGGSFILPGALKTNSYEYLIDIKAYRKLKDEEATKSDESFFKDDNCPICLDELYDNNFKVKQKDSAAKLKIKFHRRKLKQTKKNQLMIAPCQHVFHPYCLLQWMEVKMECPCCRTELPPIA